MTRPSRPLLGLLVATVAFFVLWIVALKPSSSGSGSSTNPGVGQFQPAINAAKAAVATQNHSNTAAAGNTGAATTPATATTPAATATTPAAAAAKSTTTPAKHATAAAARHHTTAPAKHATTAAARRHATARHHATAVPSAATPAQRVNMVNRSLARHKVLALLFYNPAAADDQAVRQELRAIPTRRGRVVKLAIPLSELASYPVITNQVLIQTSPTLAIVDRHAQAFTLVGFLDGLEISQRVDYALSVH
ncbi:MAG TPA: hypothetical protein VG295_01385 [Solirubrobacteraceae bacterium]|nr:hypothetical protein [Solirubrobacteraceae bacterium]